MPQVWLSYDELAEFLDCPVEEARHTAIDQEWPRQYGVDRVMRFQLPPQAALKYVLLNARAPAAPPRDAVLFEQALRDVEELKVQLSVAHSTLELQSEMAAADADADLQVSALQELASTMREAASPKRGNQRRSAA